MNEVDFHKKKWFYQYIFLFSLLQASSASQCFDDAANILSEYDSLLCGRQPFKELWIAKGASKEKFLKNLVNFTSNGTSYDSLRTSDWLSEILQGLGGSYTELKELRNSAAGYQDLTPNNMVDYFSVRSGTDKKRYYKLKMTGAFTRGWMIEQLENRKGYRIYQSTGDAYSLKAWLTVNPYIFKTQAFQNDRHIVYWEENYKRVEAFLERGGKSMNDLSKVPAFMRPWLSFVKNYNKTRIIHNLRRAWVSFGGRRILSQDKFLVEYLGLLKNLTIGMQPYFQTGGLLWTDHIDDIWIDLFGSPNTHCYPNVSYSAGASALPKFLKLQVKLIEELSLSVSSNNAKILARSVSHDTNNLGQCSHANHIGISFFIQVFVIFVILISYIL